jgi:flavin reductase (DIM6/NTAB) family NADH-FMN oxidoreductase RutF
MKKRDHPVDDVRRFLEPGPVVLVSSAWKGKTNIMTMGWHMVMSEEPSLVGCFIWDRNHSFEMIRRSRECVINVPTVTLATTVVRSATRRAPTSTSSRGSGSRPCRAGR